MPFDLSGFVNFLLSTAANPPTKPISGNFGWQPINPADNNLNSIMNHAYGGGVRGQNSNLPTPVGKAEPSRYMSSWDRAKNAPPKVNSGTGSDTTSAGQVGGATAASPTPATASPTSYPVDPNSTFSQRLSSFNPSLGRWAGLIENSAAKYGVPANIVASLMNIEAGSGDPRATSPMNYGVNGQQIGQAKGLMQVMPFHFRPGEDPYDPETNLRVALERVLVPNYQRYGNYNSAAAGYFGAVDNKGNPTTSTDAIGFNGFQYVQKFIDGLRRLGG